MAIKIYFAGPNVFHPDAERIESEISNFCIAKGIEALVPGDSGIDWSNPNTFAIARQIFQINRDHLLNCDAVIANVTPFRGACIDDGTAWEIGFAAALNKPIATYGFGPLTTSDCIKSVSGIMQPETTPQRDKQGFLIEEFGFASNLMISCSVVEHVHHNFDVYTEICRAIDKPVEIISNYLFNNIIPQKYQY